MKAKYCWLFVPFLWHLFQTELEDTAKNDFQIACTMAMHWLCTTDSLDVSVWLYFHCAVFVFLLTFSRQNYLVKKGFNVIAGKRSIRRFSGCLSLEGKSGKSYRYLCKPAISGAFEGSRKHTFWDWTQCWFWKLSRNIHVQYIKFKLPHMGSQCNIWCPLNKPKNFIYFCFGGFLLIFTLTCYVHILMCT